MSGFGAFHATPVVVKKRWVHDHSGVGKLGPTFQRSHMIMRICVQACTGRCRKLAPSANMEEATEKQCRIVEQMHMLMQPDCIDGCRRMGLGVAMCVVTGDHQNKLVVVIVWGSCDSDMFQPWHDGG